MGRRRNPCSCLGTSGVCVDRCVSISRLDLDSPLVFRVPSYVLLN